MTNVRAQNVGVRVELRAEVKHEIVFSSLKIVGLDGINALWEGAETDQIVDVRGQDRASLEVIEWSSYPRVRLNDVQMVPDHVLYGFDGQALALLNLNLEVGALIHELFIRGN